MDRLEDVGTPEDALESGRKTAADAQGVAADRSDSEDHSKPSWIISIGFHGLMLVLASLIVSAIVPPIPMDPIVAMFNPPSPPPEPLDMVEPDPVLPPPTFTERVEWIPQPDPAGDASAADPADDIAVLEKMDAPTGGDDGGSMPAEALVGLGESGLEEGEGTGTVAFPIGRIGDPGDGIGEPVGIGPKNPFRIRFDRKPIGGPGDKGWTIGADAAVERALRWLAAHQEPDGRWDCRKNEGMLKGRDNVKGAMSYDVAVTGLSVLSFLGAGHTINSPKYGGTVRKALYWLEDHQDRKSGRWPGSHYGQAIATLAMAEAYGMGCGHGDAAQKAMDYLARSQNADGGWNYGTGEEPAGEKGPLWGRHRSDTSITGWHVMAAKSGKLADLKVDPSIFEKARKYFGAAGTDDYDSKGALVFYSVTNGKTATNAAEGQDAVQSIAMLSLLFMGDNGQGPWMQKASAAVKARGVDLGNFYYLYYGSLAMFQLGGDNWKAWNRMMCDPLIRLQRRGGADDGSWNPDERHGPYGGRVYQTAMGAMTLEVYYRYLPVLGTNR
ncbi:MAG: hypothetical protein AAB215_06590 [Planctomycetota bacterium]